MYAASRAAKLRQLMTCIFYDMYGGEYGAIVWWEYGVVSGLQPGCVTLVC